MIGSLTCEIDEILADVDCRLTAECLNQNDRDIAQQCAQRGERVQTNEKQLADPRGHRLEGAIVALEFVEELLVAQETIDGE